MTIDELFKIAKDFIDTNVTPLLSEELYAKALLYYKEQGGDDQNCAHFAEVLISKLKYEIDSTSLFPLLCKAMNIAEYDRKIKAEENAKESLQCYYHY